MLPTVRRFSLLWALFLIGRLDTSHAHGDGPWDAKELHWHAAHIMRVVGGGSPLYTNPHEVPVGGRDCVAGTRLNFDVSDAYAFDIDESVQLSIEFYKDADEQTIRLVYDGNDGDTTFATDLAQRIDMPSTPLGFWRVDVPLSRARFANGGFARTDFALRGEREFVVCDISVRRSFTTPSPRDSGHVTIRVLDENGSATPARMGIYDNTGKLPLPGDDAILIKGFNNTSRIVPMRPGSVAWPVGNRSAFYVDGLYRARLPQGDYDVIVSKGPEYRIARQRMTVRAGSTLSINILLKRWTHAASDGWYSGDVHIHYAREGAADNRTLLKFIEAEDLNLGNILQMGNSAAVYFRQYDWQAVSNEDGTAFALVPGQEDPRNSRIGHTLHLNLREPVRIPTRYPLFYEVFERTRAKGATTGYAHAGYGGSPNTSPRGGLALDVPFGLVDFVEILQIGTSDPNTWFDFLNLGYKLSPAAGTDYPYAGTDVPGAVRNYVHVNGDFSPGKWFQGLRQGRTFITNGPLLKFTVNDHAMGGDLYLKRSEPLKIEASATINPDIDLLDRIELIEHGEIIETVSSTTGATKLSLSHAMPATTGSWLVVRAYGKRYGEHKNVVALTAPIYVHVEGSSFWKPAVVPEIAERLKASMRAMLTDQRETLENWDTDEPDARYWQVQKWLLKKRIADASMLYDELSKRAKSAE